VTRLYTCDRGQFTPAGRGYNRMSTLLLVGAILTGINVTISAGFAFIVSGVVL
jgi:hypothetical protein